MASFLSSSRGLHIKPSRDDVKVIRIILLGDSGIGKTSLIFRLVKGVFNENYRGTICVETMKKEIEVDSRRYILKIVDTAGQERFRSLTHNFYRGTDCCLLTFALDDYCSFLHLSDWQDEFLRFHHSSNIRTQSAFPFLVIGNKADSSSRMRAVSDSLAREWCMAHGNIPYFETSAKTGLNIFEIFSTAVRRVRDFESMDLPSVRYSEIDGNDKADLNKHVVKKKISDCCP